MGIFLLIVPSLIIGPHVQRRMPGNVVARMVMPFVAEGAASPSDHQPVDRGRDSTGCSPAGATGRGRTSLDRDVNIVSLSPWVVRLLIKGVVAGLLVLLALLCRTRTRDRRDPRLLGEFALVVLTMLFVSERSWKHHYVTVLLPISYLVSEFFSPRVGPRGRAAIVLAWALAFGLMASTSPEIGGLFGEGQGHEIAQSYGLFMWAGVVLYATVAWCVWRRRKELESADTGDAPATGAFQSAHVAIGGYHRSPGALREIVLRRAVRRRACRLRRRFSTTLARHHGSG